MLNQSLSRGVPNPRDWEDMESPKRPPKESRSGKLSGSMPAAPAEFLNLKTAIPPPEGARVVQVSAPFKVDKKPHDIPSLGVRTKEEESKAAFRAAAKPPPVIPAAPKEEERGRGRSRHRRRRLSAPTSVRD